jgi:hypothetical protein
MTKKSLSVQKIALKFQITFLLVLRNGHNMQPERYPAPSACRVLDLAAVLRLAVNRDEVWQADVNPMSSEAIPLRNTFVNAE